MTHQLLAGGFISLVNFAIHAVFTGLIVVLTRHIAGRTDDLHVFMRLTALMMTTLLVLVAAHMIEITVWACYYTWADISIDNATSFEFAFENYTALGYGDGVPAQGKRLVGPITALNGLLLIGWSVAIIFEVMRLADIQIGPNDKAGR